MPCDSSRVLLQLKGSDRGARRFKSNELTYCYVFDEELRRESSNGMQVYRGKEQVGTTNSWKPQASQTSTNAPALNCSQPNYVRPFGGAEAWKIAGAGRAMLRRGPGSAHQFDDEVQHWQKGALCLKLVII